MKLRIDTWDPSEETYTITLGTTKMAHYVWNMNIVEYLNISIEEYNEILIKNGAIVETNIRDYGHYYVFKDVENAQNAVKELEPYLIMALLTK